MANTLYVVPTPIGNLDDITLRALRVLREVSLIAAEDTRTTRILLDHFEIKTPLTSYHQHNERLKLDAIFDALAVGDVALVSDAGTPGISDPGAALIAAAVERGVRVEALPGACAAITALVASGLPTDGFVFAGFLPKKDRALRTALAGLAREPRTLIFYESPNRLTDTLAALSATLGDRRVCVGRELTKLYEEYVRGTASEVLAHFQAREPRGEIVIIVEGAPPEQLEQWDADQVLAALQTRLDAGDPLSAAAKTVAAASGWDRKAVYALAVEKLR
jgi:16S rRNA (cytidine1402-2'-O)-methyltransferase